MPAHGHSRCSHLDSALPGVARERAAGPEGISRLVRSQFKPRPAHTRRYAWVEVVSDLRSIHRRRSARPVCWSISANPPHQLCISKLSTAVNRNDPTRRATPTRAGGRLRVPGVTPRCAHDLRPRVADGARQPSRRQRPSRTGRQPEWGGQGPRGRRCRRGVRSRAPAEARAIRGRYQINQV